MASNCSYKQFRFMCLHFNIYGAMIKWQNYDIELWLAGCIFIYMLLVFLKHPCLLRSSLGGRAVKRNCAGAVGLVVTGPWWWGGSPISRLDANEWSPVIREIRGLLRARQNDIIKCSPSNDANYFVRIYYSKFGKM